jgi:hypothetical protein
MEKWRGKHLPSGESQYKDEAVGFDPSKFQTQTSGELEPLGKKKSPLKKLR